MEELLRFPERYRVSMSISRETFFREAILKPDQRKLMEQVLEHLQLLYVLPFRDSEVVVLTMEINDTVRFYHVLAEEANILHCTIPYPILLVLKCEGVVKFYLLEEEETTQDRDKMVLWNPCSSKNILLNEIKPSDNRFLERLRKGLEESNSAFGLCKKWRDIVYKHHDVEEGWNHEARFFNQSLVRSRDLRQQEMFMGYTIEQGQRYLYSDEDDRELFPEPVLDEKREWEHRFFLDYCCGHARSLYDQLESDQPIPEEEWLRNYIIACNDYANLYYVRSLSNSGVRKIVAAFWAGEQPAPDDEAIDYFSEEDLKDLMGPRFYHRSMFTVDL